jgi:5-methylcytosine-specific restriction endonuclease McrBC GTP-binding regulatory subunit McrB
MNAAQVEAQMTGTTPDNVVSYCAQRGFSFEPELIARYIASFLAKPFVILAGVSGTGKSKLAELVAEYYSRTTTSVEAPAQLGAPAAHTGSEYVFVESVGAPDPNKFALVAVRPDWIDNQSVLGFVNPITQAYESTQALDLILRAEGDLSASENAADAPRYFMLLDEMNLAKVEHYFSDWLACSESRRYMPDGTISQQAIPLHRSTETLTATLAVDLDGTQTTVVVPENLILPTNLIVTGTVNVDETTYGLSPKVLDRAMVLEFDEVDLDRLRGEAAVAASAAFKFPDELPRFRLPTNRDYHEIPAATHVHLKAINSILENARLHFGYRSASEMARFMVIYSGFLPELAAQEADDDWLRALDVALLQKVLPRLQGNRAKLEQTLVRMCLYLRDLADNGEAAITTAFDRASPAKLPKSYRRALEMLDALRDFGFVSFFK